SASGYTGGTSNGFVTVTAGQDTSITVSLQPTTQEAYEVAFTYPPSGPGDLMQLTVWITGPNGTGGRFRLVGVPHNDANTPPTDPRVPSISGTTTPDQTIKIWTQARQPGVYRVYVSQWASVGQTNTSAGSTLCNTPGLGVSLLRVGDGMTWNFSPPSSGCSTG